MASASLTDVAGGSLRFPHTPAWEIPLTTETPKRAGAPIPQSLNGVPGVNVIGYFRGQFGLGESARAYACALMHSGIPVSLYNVSIDLLHDQNDQSLNAWISQELPYPVTLIFVNPDLWEQALEQIGRERLRGHYLIACWFWELEKVPAEWAPLIDEVDALMVATEFIEQAFRRVTNKPILHVPYPLMDIKDSGLQRKDFGLENDKFLFLTSFDFNSALARKNPFAVINAFISAFPTDDDSVRLLVKSGNGVRYPDKLNLLIRAARRDSRIIVRDEIIDRRHVRALQRCCDAYVSLHRAEGLGLGLAECMAMGKPVIGTGWSGNMDFMSAENSCLVDYHLVKIRKGEFSTVEEQRWADADVSKAASWMRRVVDEPDFRDQIGTAAKDFVSERLSLTNAGAVFKTRLKVILKCPGIDQRQQGVDHANG